MAATISQGVTPIPAGARSFTIDNLPAASEGFTLKLGRHSSWNGTGTLFQWTINYSPDGVIFKEWIKGTFVREALNRQDQPADFSMDGLWPGEAVNEVRQKKPASALRISLTVPTTFTAASVDFAWL